MTSNDIINVIVGLLLCALVIWLCWRAANKPRTTPKIPRDRSQDTQVFFWIRLF